MTDKFQDQPHGTDKKKGGRFTSVKPPKVYAIPNAVWNFFSSCKNMEVDPHIVGTPTYKAILKEKALEAVEQLYDLQSAYITQYIGRDTTITRNARDEFFDAYADCLVADYMKRL